MSRVSRISPEVRERAVRVVGEHAQAHGSQWAAIKSIAEKIGCNPKPHYPLEAGGVALRDDQAQAVNILAGGFQLLHFRAKAGTNAMIRITGAGGSALPANTIVTLIRVN
jgi:hypothetical protein